MTAEEELHMLRTQRAKSKTWWNRVGAAAAILIGGSIVAMIVASAVVLIRFAVE